MKVSRTAKLFLVLLTGVALQRCDTSHNIANPSKNYFLKYYGGEGPQTGVDLVVNTDGTFYLLGTSRKPNQLARMYLVKADPLGNVIWEKTFGGSQGLEAKDIELTTNGIVIAGNSNSLTKAGSRDIYLATMDNADTIIHSITYGFQIVPSYGGGEADEDVVSVTVTLDGGFIVSGSSDHVDLSAGPTLIPTLRDALHVRFNSDLTIYSSTWRPAHGTYITNLGTKVIQNGNDHFYFFGSSSGVTLPTDLNYWILDLNAFGDAGGDEFHPGYAGSDERLGSVTSSGNVFFLGGISTTSQASELFASYASVKADSTLSYAPSQLDKTIGSDLGTPGAGNTSAASSGLGWLCLTNEATTGNSNLYLTKLDGTNNLAWKSPVIYGGAGNDFMGSVTELPDGKLLIIGTMAIGQDGETKMVLMKVNKDGQFSD
jgi:hypothetical protein